MTLLNWLPGAQRPLLGAMRLYFPKPEALDGTRKKKPPMTKTQ